ncbi:hypothetical protein OH76DRAFT_1488051 [Lentinus brumalis]|uniref:Uncharacterized protein n=1 Tax=Lentinus brumalis TaxID=2498619 RepID=A0A371CS87_9APHY|nr:hypothetical protein OH76DRAFT_1488051 [Polyporus brumalis]
MLSVIRLAAFAVLILSLLSAVIDVSARAVRETNGERLARGLGPARPRRLYAGTRTNAARAVPSGSPGTTQRGVIKLIAPSTGSVLAYMTATGATTNVASAHTFTYNIPSPSNALVGFTDVTSSSALSEFASTYVFLGNNRATTVRLMGVVAGSTAAGGAAVSAESASYNGGYAETTVFGVDPSTGKITVQWVNPDGTVVNPHFYLYQSTVYGTGDFVALSQSSDTTGWAPVDLYYDTITVSAP